MQDWTNRIWAEFRAGNLSRASRDTLLTLRTFRGGGGAIYPSHSTLADRARCCVRTVARALVQARELGLVSWTERRVRAGWRWLRTSNRYSLTIPAGPVVAVPRRTGGHSGRGGESLENKKALLMEMMRAAAAAPDLLAARAAVIHQRLARGVTGAGG